MPLNEGMYPYTAKEARERGEIELWRANFRANCACAGAIELAIRRDFDGMYLKDGCAKSVIDQYGYKRVGFVLANTLQEHAYDGRYHEANKQWSRRIFIPSNGGHRLIFVVNSHPAVLDGFVSDYRGELARLHLFGTEHCLPDTGEQDFTDKVLVLSPDTLRGRGRPTWSWPTCPARGWGSSGKSRTSAIRIPRSWPSCRWCSGPEDCWQPENQLWLAHSGFGCLPHARGRSVLCTCLADGETIRWNRSEFVGVIRDECIPDWAAEKLAQLRQEQPERTQEMTM